MFVMEPQSADIAEVHVQGKIVYSLMAFIQICFLTELCHDFRYYA